MGVGICDGIADGDERIEQGDEVEHPGLGSVASQVPRPRRLAEGAAFDKPHGVERLLIVGPERQLINRHNTRML